MSESTESGNTSAESEANDTIGICTTLTNLGLLGINQGRLAQAREWLEENLVLGRRIGDAKLLVRDVDELANVIREEAIDVMVIAVPAKAAQRVLNQVMSAGIKAVLNFAPVSLTSRRGVKVKTVDLTTSLESLSYFLSQPSNSTVTQLRGRSDSKENFTHTRKGAKEQSF